MDPEIQKALSQISETLGCSWGEARQFCAKIQSYQENRESSYIDIWEVLQLLENKEGSYSDREIAKRAEEITRAKTPDNELPNDELQRKDAPSKITVDHPRIEKFEGPDEHQAFIDWIDHNSAEGFVLNLRGEGSDAVIHSASCSHLSPNPKKDRVATSHVKLCSTDWEALWIKAQNLAAKHFCPYCEV
jgi:hypothetical protein